MTDRRWQQIEGIFHDALERAAADRSAFVVDACAGDEGLRAEVEALLAHASDSSGWLRNSLGGIATENLLGTQLGVYKVISQLGAGGMGEVYRARDTRLGRDVAVKVLPQALASDPDRLKRFEREARILAALNHPHIAAIYGFEEVAGVRALILELVDGPTLAERLKSPLSLTDALSIARQVVDALEAAHARGIVHRDLKPANIALTPGGIVKVLDFGLAKAFIADGDDQQMSHAPTLTATATREGALLGTAAYMSPEQARGKSLDKRTDVWAFGCVLFEMLSGRPAFAAETLSDTLARVIEREPAWDTLPARTPARLRQLLRRCLQKKVEKRLSDLAEARRDIDACLTSPFKVSLAILESVRWRLSRPIVRWVSLVVVVAAALTLYSVSRSDTSLPQLTNPIQVTSAVGVEDHPTWSPDNATLAYEANESGNWDIWLVRIAGGSAVNWTSDSPGDDRYPSWSPDGRSIAFWSDREGGGYYVVPALGGAATRLISTVGTNQQSHSAPEWSADGTQLAAVTYRIDGSRFTQLVEIVSIVTRQSRTMNLPGTEEARLDLSWSPDGRFLAYVDAGQQPAEVTRLRVLRLADGAAFEMTDGRTNVRRPRWSADGRYLFFTCNCVGPTDLWRRRVDDGLPAGEAERVTAGLEVRDVSLSRDGSRVAYSRGRWVSNFWRVPILENRPATWGDAEQITFDQAYIEFLDVSSDGQRVVYSSDRTGNQDIWMMPIGGQPTQLTADAAPDWAPDWSPDGERLAFYSYRTGDRELWTMPASGGPATQLTRSKGLDAGTEWSPDGREIAFRSERTGNSDIWVIAADGSRERRITDHPAGDWLSAWSPDGHWLAFGSNRSGQNGIWRVSSKGGEPELMTNSAGAGPRWSHDGTHLYFRGALERAGNLWGFSIRDRTERPMTHLVGKRGTIGVMQPETDGRFLYFPWRDDVGDIWVMDLIER